MAELHGLSLPVLAAGVDAGRLSPPLRVAVLSLHTSPTASLGHSANGGMNVYVREVCRELDRRGVATDIFTRRVDDDGPQVEGLAPSSRVVYLPAGPPGLGKYRLLDRVPEFSRAVEDFMAGTGLRYDLLYSHYWLGGLAACALRGRLRRPWVHTAHTLAVVKNRNLAPGDRPEPEFREDLEGEISRCADLLVVSTESEGGDLRRAYGIGPERVRVVSPGCDLDGFHPMDREAARRRLGYSDSDRLFVFVGRLERLKGVEVILRAMALVRSDARHPEARLLILGEDSETVHGSEHARLAALTRELGIADRVDFLGPVQQPELASYYAAAEACLMPSFSESFGLVGLEAQACGTPLIASNVAGLASVVRDGVTGFLIDGPDPAAYAARLLALLEDPGQVAKLGGRGARLATGFTWKRTVDGLLSAFEELLEPDFLDVPRFTFGDQTNSSAGQVGVQATSVER